MNGEKQKEANEDEGSSKSGEKQKKDVLEKTKIHTYWTGNPIRRQEGQKMVHLTGKKERRRLKRRKKMGLKERGKKKTWSTGNAQEETGTSISEK